MRIYGITSHFSLSFLKTPPFLRYVLSFSLDHAWQTQTSHFGFWIADFGINIKTVHFLLLQDTLSHSFVRYGEKEFGIIIFSPNILGLFCQRNYTLEQNFTLRMHKNRLKLSIKYFAAFIFHLFLDGYKKAHYFLKYWHKKYLVFGIKTL